jgi:hypothetical protein
MATALNMTMTLKQDADSKQRLKNLKEAFAASVQPLIDQVLAESEIVHYARVLVIDDQYIQVITEFDGKSEDYTEFFRVKAPRGLSRDPHPGGRRAGVGGIEQQGHVLSGGGWHEPGRAW